MMRKYVLFVLLSTVINYTLMAQEPYILQWKQLKIFENEGKPKSAMDMVTTIYDQAQKEGNPTQIIKALMHKAKYMLQLEEDAQLKIIQEFKDASATHTFPTKNILESILANLYWQYFQQQRRQFYNRTKTATKVDTEDFRTWDLQTLFEEVHFHFQNSLQNGVLAQQTALSDFDGILFSSYNSKEYRPTLYDFLSHNALAFYKTPETDITKPSYAFEIDDPVYLKESKLFSKISITTKDSLSLQFHALKIYQNLIRFHAKDAQPTALIDVNIERLYYIKENATFTEVDTVLLQTLEAERKHYAKQEAAALYDYEIAQWHKRQGDTYAPDTNEAQRWELKKAIDICTATIQEFPTSRGAQNCKALREQILAPELAITTEKIIPIQTAGRLLFSYKNLDTIHCKALAINRKQLKALHDLYREDEIVQFLNALPVRKTWSSKLCNEYDYQQHTTEVVVPELEAGTYIVVAAPTKELSHERFFAYGNFQISNLTLIEHNTPEQFIFQVVDRVTGAPVPNAKVQLKSEYYGDNRKLNTTLTTNEKGEAYFKAKAYYYEVSITITHQKDKVYIKRLYMNESYTPQTAPQAQQSTFLFTDRSIYRPGQTVYFKGIVMSSVQHKKHIVVPNRQSIVTLYDGNGQAVKNLTLTTNAYGSFQGTFVLPSSGLTGQYSIRTDTNHNTFFSVEEYKRPKFETYFTPVTQTYAVNDSILVKGMAKAFAGSTISEAKVVYRIQRQVQYPRWCLRCYNTTNQEISNGETTTDEKGEFIIPFKALPDAKSKPENLPVFSYLVTADVTDVNGETHSTTTLVQVGYHTVTASIQIPRQLDKSDKIHALSVYTQNLNGQAAKAKGTVVIHKLIAPQYPMRKRPWDAPYYAGFTKEEFKKLYPHDAYENEDDYRQWRHGKRVYKNDFKTTIDGDHKGVQELSLGKIKAWEPGYYKVVLQSTDPAGMPLKDVHYVAVVDPKATQISDQQLFQITTDTSSYRIGDKVALTVRSASKDITVTIDVEKNHKIIKTQLVHLSNESKTITIPVETDDLGGFAVHYSFVNYNSYEAGSLPIAVPYAPTALQIETKTFRDKLQPGQEETWSFTIKGPKGDRVAAEVLASMYDASLDQFRRHYWSFSPIYQPVYYTRTSRSARQSFGVSAFRTEIIGSGYGFDCPSYDRFNWFNLYFVREVYFGHIRRRMLKKMAVPMESAEMEMDEIVADEGSLGEAREENKAKDKEENEFTLQDAIGTGTTDDAALDEVSIRKNLQETAFFFPQLTTDAEGNVSFSFTAPEALTRWKLQLVAHTKTLNAATHSLETVTQKELMVIPNPPRFLREGDRIVLSTKIASLADQQLDGIAELQLLDAVTGNAIDLELQNTNKRQQFSVDAQGNTSVSWTLQIPDTYQAVQYTILAKAGEFSDGEQSALPVLSNRMLVTETLPMWIRSNQTKTFTLDKLQNTTSTTLKHHQLTLEMTSNPAWYAVQALPYLMEYPHECAEQTFSRYYANSLAGHIVNSNPRIQEVFTQWKSSDALLSTLEKNEELKSLLIQETPWLRDAQSETEQKKRIALLFDFNKMNAELQSALRKLQQLQYGSGAFPWFKGGRENRYITQHIASGLGHLKKLNVTTPNADTSRMLKKAVGYLDQQFVEEYKELKRYCKEYKIDINNDHLSYTQVQYLYMRSFFPDIKTPKNTLEAKAYYMGQAQKYWLQNSLYSQGMLALILHRNGNTTTATKIIRSLDEKSITNEELGMYWKSNAGGWYWYQAPIETQALMIEVFAEIEAEPKRSTIVDNLKIWLLKHKQTNQWSTTKSTSEAIYALLLQGNDWLSVTDMVDITLGTQKIDPSQMEDVKVEAGTGYFKTAWKGKEITPEMATTTITKKGKGIAWGALYWQYFENLDKITSAETPLSLRKKLFLKKNTDRGEEITEITEQTKLQLGDLVRVRIELRSDRDMEFVHMKDMRASGLEPINVLSQYKWQDGLGYYESTKDASTHFFFDYLPKGVYVFEYDLRVNNKGEFSNGITTIQSMYAPEFSSHSEGVRIRVE